VPDTRRKKAFDAQPEGLQGLAGNADHQIRRDAPEERHRGLEGGPSSGRIVPALQGDQLNVDKRLNADREPVDPDGTKLRELLGRQVAGVRLRRDLSVGETEGSSRAPSTGKSSRLDVAQSSSSEVDRIEVLESARRLTCPTDLLSTLQKSFSSTSSGDEKH
jgi:hypothetical protein